MRGARFSSSGARPAVLVMVMAESLTEEQKAALIVSLRIEREGYVKRGLEYRVELVEARIAELGGAPTHQVRAVRRPRSSPVREAR